MNMKKGTQKKIVDEFQFIIEKMEQSSSEAEKLYFFSGTFGLLQRLFNLEYDEELVYAHFILRATHEAFVQRMKAIQGGETTVPLYTEQFDRLLALTKELLAHVEQGELSHDSLKKFVVLSYSTGGNGYYLVQKGMMQF